MFRKFPPENPCWTLLEEVIPPKRSNQRVAEDKSVHPPFINQIIHALNLQTRYNLGCGEANAAKRL